MIAGIKSRYPKSERHRRKSRGKLWSVIQKVGMWVWTLEGAGPSNFYTRYRFTKAC